MAIGTRYDFPNESNHLSSISQFYSAEKFIQNCELLLKNENGIASFKQQGKNTLIETIFQRYCVGDFDHDLDSLLSVIIELASRGAFDDGWKEDCYIDNQYISCKQAALKHYKKLKTENHHQHEIAWDILEILITFDNDYGSLPEDIVTLLPKFQTAEQFINACQLLLDKGMDPLELIINQKNTLSEIIFLHYFNGDFDEDLAPLLSIIESLAEKKPFYKSCKMCFQGIAMSRYKQLIASGHPHKMVALDILEIVISDLSRDCLIQQYEPILFSPFLYPNDFIDMCEQHLCEGERFFSGGISRQLLQQEFSLIDFIFHYYYRGNFDKHLSLLSSFIHKLPKQKEIFKKIAGSLDLAEGEYEDMSYQGTALLVYRRLKREEHPNTNEAFNILETVTQSIDIDGCLNISYFEKLAPLIRKTQPNPNQEKNRNYKRECLMESIFSALAEGEFDECMEVFPDIVRALLDCGGDPNFRFGKITIQHTGDYMHPTCLHITYLYWRLMVDLKQEAEAKWLKQAFFHLLEDLNVDVRTPFTETNLYHFSRHFPGDVNGGHIEKGTLAHYALIAGDLKTCQKILSLAPDLISSHCRIVSQLKKRRIEGEFKYSRSVKHPEISLCHIAARRLDPIACTYLIASGAANHISQAELIKYAQFYEKDQYSNHFGRRRYEKLPDAKNLEKNLKRFNEVRKALKHSQPLPRTATGLQNPHWPRAVPILERTGYTLAFDGRTKIPLWGYEDLTSESLKGGVERKSNFTLDPDIPRHLQARTSDYTNSGFDRGHCASAANHKSSELEMKETFYISNVFPQTLQLNRGYWQSFEKHVRDLTNKYDHVHVVTGPLFQSYEEHGKRFVKYQVIGENEVAVPTGFFKVISLEKNGIEKKKAYIIPNHKIPADTHLSKYREREISKLEKITGLIFQHSSIHSSLR
jgi:endonuclease G, mitochondrial